MPVTPNNNISGFVNAFAGGGVRTNLFKVTGVIPVPGAANSEAISFLVKSAQIPASSLGTIEVPYRGRRIKLPGDRTFQDWSITVISDANLTLRSGFESWSALYNQHVANTGPTNFMQFMPTWKVTQLYRDGNAIRTYHFIGCFPSEVGSIDLSYENNDAIAEFPVTLNYSYWEAAPGDADGDRASGTVPGGQSTVIGSAFGEGMG